MADKKKAPKKTADKPAEKPPGGRLKLIILIVILLLLLAGGGGAAYYFLWYNKPADASESEASAETATEETAPPTEEGTAPPPEFAPLTYHQLKPKGFRVNLAPGGPARFLQVNLTITTPNPAVIAAVEKHMPMLSNDILTVLAAQEYATLNTSEGKDTLRESLRQTLVRLLARTGEPSDIRDVLFNELIMQ